MAGMLKIPALKSYASNLRDMLPESITAWARFGGSPYVDKSEWEIQELEIEEDMRDELIAMKLRLDEVSSVGSGGGGAASSSDG